VEDLILVGEALVGLQLKYNFLFFPYLFFKGSLKEKLKLKAKKDVNKKIRKRIKKTTKNC